MPRVCLNSRWLRPNIVAINSAEEVDSDMGNEHSSVRQQLQDVQKRTIERVGTLAIHSRYHKSRKLEEDYVLDDKVLGSGYNGSVFLARSTDSGLKYAVKGFKLNGVKAEKKQELLSECEIFLSMDHPHVVRLVDVYEAPETLFLVMECMEGGELFKRVQAKRRFSEKDAADATWQMLLAVQYLHKHAIVHRDLKLENFLYEKNDSNYLKLIDFGFSKIWDPNTKMALSCGTLAYVAPEVLAKSYTSICDMWSLGVIVFILLFGYMPFKGSEAAQVRSIKNGNYLHRPEVWSKVTPQGQDFVKALLQVDVNKRLTAGDAMEHEWIRSRSMMEHNAEENVEIATALANFGNASEFRRLAMNMCAWALTNEERAMVREAFLAIDQDKQGTISPHEFKALLEDNLHIHESDEQIKACFDAMDINHDDQIHYSEFLAAMVSSRITLHEEMLKRTFKRFDHEGKGFITSASLKDILGDTITVDAAEHLVHEVDTDGNGKIELEEFMGYLKGGQVADHHAHAAVLIIDKAVASGEQHPLQTKQLARMKSRPLATGKLQVRGGATGDDPQNGTTEKVPKSTGDKQEEEKKKEKKCWSCLIS